MSRFGMIPIELLQDKRLTDRDRRVYMALAIHADKDGAAHPRREVLAELTGLPASRISEQTTRLQTLGWLQKVGNGGRSKPTEYVILTPQTVTESVTVTKTVTDTNTVSKTDTKTVTVKPETVTKTVRGKEHTNKDKQTNEQTKEKTYADSGQNQPPSDAGGFDQFWAAYPRKASKPAAQKAYKTLLKKEPGVLPEILKDLTTRFSDTEQRFIPYPATYLNNHRWRDEQLTAFAGNAPATGQLANVFRGAI